MQNFDKYLKKLPIIPEVASKILSIGEEGQDFSFKTLEDIISVDPMLTSRILRVANSAMYARQKEITTLQMAIGLLGFKNIRSLVLLLTASQFSKDLKGDEFYSSFWKHSIVTAFISREIFTRIKDRANQEIAFTLGLLHDIGRVALFNADPNLYMRVISLSSEQSVSLISMEREVLKYDHQEIGAAVMQHWNLPEIFVDTVREHGNYNITSPFKKIIKNITIADILAGQLGYGGFSDHDDDILNDLIENSALIKDDLDYFRNDYTQHLEQDPLFKECERLFLDGKD